MRKLIGILSVVTLFALMACNNNCYVPTRALLGVAFVDSVKLTPLTVQQVTVKGEGNDSILYNATSQQTVFLPLHQNQSVTRFEVSFLRSNTDTIVTPYILEVNHTPFPQLISPECGCVMFHSIESAQLFNATDTLDVEVYSTNVINVESDVHLKVYL